MTRLDGERGLTLQELEAAVQEQLGRPMQPDTIEKMIALGYLEQQGDLYYRTEQGLEYARVRKLYKSVLDAIMGDDFVLDDGQVVRGRPYSFVIKHLQARRVPTTLDRTVMERVFSAAGYLVGYGRSTRNRRCEVVYQKERPSVQ